LDRVEPAVPGRPSGPEGVVLPALLGGGSRLVALLFCHRMYMLASEPPMGLRLMLPELGFEAWNDAPGPDRSTMLLEPVPRAYGNLGRWRDRFEADVPGRGMLEGSRRSLLRVVPKYWPFPRALRSIVFGSFLAAGLSPFLVARIVLASGVAGREGGDGILLPVASQLQPEE
jgi:hypothetical protein